MNKTLIKQLVLIYLLVLTTIGSTYFYVDGYTLVQVMILISVSILCAIIVAGFMAIAMRYLK